ncbi:MAG: O-antigen ligase family protein [Planctomycetes bacterium]|nr:O-antigen ligase family protein [Planctomycetota bacterium]
MVATVFIVPMAMGGRVAIGQLALVILTVGAAGFWCLHQAVARQAAWVWSRAEWLLLAVLVFIGLQIVPLPPHVLRVLSPHLNEVLPLWCSQGQSAGAMGVWNTLSLTPVATRAGLVLLTAFALLFLTAVQRMRKLEDVEQLLRWIAICTVGMAAFALLQSVTSNGKYFWCYEHPFANTRSAVMGSFTNRNHFAHFIALGLGPLFWWVLGGLRVHSGPRAISERWHERNSEFRSLGVGLRFTALALVVFAGLLSLSRGGAIAMLLATVVCVLILYRGSLLGRRTVLALTVSAMLLGALLCTHGHDLVAARLHKLASIEGLNQGLGRLALWQADARAVADYPLTGTGLGSHREVCPMYFSDGRPRQDLEYTHAENGYVQVALEGGFPGLLLALVAVGMCVYWCVRSLLRKPSGRPLFCLAAVTAGLAASFVHSAVDFVWYVPGCMVVVVLLAAAACRLWQFTRDEQREPAIRSHLPRTGWVALAVGAILLGGVVLPGQLRAVRSEAHWHRFLLLGKGLHRMDEIEQQEVLQSMLAQLSAVVRWQPDHARAQCQLAALHRRLFDFQPDCQASPLSVRQVREAALASHFESGFALEEWLSRAFGQRRMHLYEARRHAREALAHCPLQAEAYLCLADLCFLEGKNSPGKNAYIEQALKVRPLDASVSYEAGIEALFEGDLDRACMHWQASFHASRVYQSRVMKLLVPQVPAPFFLETFEPDETALELLAENYRRVGRTDAYRLVLRHCAAVREERAKTTQGSEATRSWVGISEAYEALGDNAECVRCLRHAVQSDGSSYEAHYRLGTCYYKLKNYADAVEHLKWCLQRRPHDETLRSLVEAAVDYRLRLTNRQIDGAS